MKYYLNVLTAPQNSGTNISTKSLVFVADNRQ